jgi:SAM-dependent methyltransferase
MTGSTARSTEFYDDYPRIEEAFEDALDKSLNPRGPDFLYEVVASLGLPRGATVIDLGCGEGEQSIELATRFGFSVKGVDPVSRNLAVARDQLAEAARLAPGLSAIVTFETGSSDSIPASDGSVDLIWVRESLYHFPSLERAFAECRRVLRPAGWMLVYHNFVTERMEPRELAWMWDTPTTFIRNVAVAQVEEAFASADLRIDQLITLGPEFGEFSEETRGKAGRCLIHAARLLRDPQRYIARFGQANYDIMLSDCFWHVYRMIGKLESRVYVLRAPS